MALFHHISVVGFLHKLRERTNMKKLIEQLNNAGMEKDDISTMIEQFMENLAVNMKTAERGTLFNLYS